MLALVQGRFPSPLTLRSLSLRMTLSCPRKMPILALGLNFSYSVGVFEYT
jgi:hypothetical protein